MDELELMYKNNELMCLTVEYNLNKMRLYSKEGTYECKNVPKLIEKFNRINKNSYGALLDFAYHVSNCRKYYECEFCKEFATEICIHVGRFVEGYSCLLS